MLQYIMQEKVVATKVSGIRWKVQALLIKNFSHILRKVMKQPLAVLFFDGPQYKIFKLLVVYRNIKKMKVDKNMALCSMLISAFA